MKEFHVAIDGPAGSGKSTISSQIAQKLGWIHVDTGAMYRAVTLYALENQVNLNNEDSYQFLDNVKIDYQDDKILLNGKDVSREIRSEEVTNNVSLVSSFPYVREKMVFIQQKAAKGKNIIMDGRDIGTVVLPNAKLKIFLTANVEERAKRRYNEQLIKGVTVDFEELVNDIAIRDKKDSTRKESPLKKAVDACVIDTTYLTIEQVVDKIINLIEKKENEQDGY
ncbi:(d)CMP kinase [Haploplasma axanthum]|uniref:Cytidylate kinase n=1 Tax=Haploplasma axanthum TaxID=29552 RepID=A0A449BE09_HAPAX|nr:(d)CMP kinase [Haploplasma axanthum]VEU80693.1 cytidylate kinase [Haploplasma axanthum]